MAYNDMSWWSREPAKRRPGAEGTGAPAPQVVMHRDAAPVRANDRRKKSTRCRPRGSRVAGMICRSRIAAPGQKRPGGRASRREDRGARASVVMHRGAAPEREDQTGARINDGGTSGILRPRGVWMARMTPAWRPPKTGAPAPEIGWDQAARSSTTNTLRGSSENWRDEKGAPERQ